MLSPPSSSLRFPDAQHPLISPRSTLAFGFQRRPPFLDALLDFLFNALLGRLVIALGRAEIVLHDEMAGKIVRVLIALAVTEPFGARIMGITHMLRDFEGTAGFDIIQRGVNRENR